MSPRVELLSDLLAPVKPRFSGMECLSEDLSSLDHDLSSRKDDLS